MVVQGAGCSSATGIKVYLLGIIWKCCSDRLPTDVLDNLERTGNRNQCQNYYLHWWTWSWKD